MKEFDSGELVEISLDGGLAYVQVTHHHSSYPPVVRAIEGIQARRSADLAGVAAGVTKYIAVIPLQSELERLGCEYEGPGGIDIPPEHLEFPTFRTPIYDKQGEIIYWWFWNGLGLHYAVDLDQKTSRLPAREVMTGKHFIERLSTPDA